MCGIAGVVAREDGRAEEVVRHMTGCLRHRGPDGQGLFIDDRAGLALGHQRLAILDLSDAGRQPMVSRDQRWAIVFNGEIFNYLELRAGLADQCRTATDTEVLLEACAQWGVEEALERSIGMFALALWDSHERELWLARDRAGEKPLVYHWDGRTLAFASELKALGAVAERRLDPEAVDAYLALELCARAASPFSGDAVSSPRGTCCGSGKERSRSGAGGFPHERDTRRPRSARSAWSSSGIWWATRSGCGCARMCRWHYT